MEKCKLQELYDTVTEWPYERQQELMRLIHERWYESNAVDFTDAELDEQFEELDDGESE